MRRDEHGAAVRGRLGDELVDDLLHERVEPGGRLVEDGQRRAVHERLDEPDLLPVPLRERLDRPVELELEAVRDPLSVTEVGHPAQRREVAEVLPRREPLVQAEVAGEVAEVPPRLRAGAADVHPEELDPPGGRPDQVEQQPDGGGLAGAVRAEVAEDLTLADLEREVGNTAIAAVVLRQVIGSNDRRGHCLKATCAPDGRGTGRASGRGYAAAVAAPVRKGEEVEVRIDSLAYGGNGVGRLDGFVVFVRGGLPGDLVRARATKVKRGFAEATRTELLEPGPGPGRGAVQALRDVRRLPVPGPRVRAPGRGEARAGTRRARPPRRLRDAAARADRSRALGLPLSEQARVLVRAGRGRARARLPSRGPLGRGDRRRGVPPDHRGRQRGARRRRGLGAVGGARAVRPGHAERLPAPPRRPRGPEHGPGCSYCS